MRAAILAVVVAQVTTTTAHAQPATPAADAPEQAEPAEQANPPEPTPTPAEPAIPSPAPPPAEPAPEPTPDPAAAPAPAVEPTPLPPAPEATAPSRNKDAAWLFIGGALTFVTAGAVLAYSTSSAEQDLEDLYITTGSAPPAFDASTRRRYDALVDEGERYELLSIVSFSLAGACAAGAAYFFWRASNEALAAMPVITPTSAGVRLRF